MGESEQNNILSAVLYQLSYLGCSMSGKPLTRNGLDQILYRLKERAGVTTEGGAHLFRHTWATMYLANGGDVYKLSSLAGQQHVSTTEGYVSQLKKLDARKGGLSVLDSL